MLREIRPEDVAEYERDEIVILYREAIWTPDELAEELGLRFLVDNDEPAVAAYESEEEMDPEEEEPEEVDEEDLPVAVVGEIEVRKETTKRRRRSPEEIEAMIRDAINNGFMTTSEIAKATGLTYKTVQKYLPGI